MAVHLENRNGVAILILNNPPVNALSGSLREAISRRLEQVSANSTLQGLVLACAGRTFAAGADISELGQVKTPMLRDVIEQIEALAIPSIAALHGTALGGGFELALGCTFRSADRAARIGLPEVRLGLLPGAGGTVRTTYLAGPQASLRLAGGGEPIDAEAGKALGLIDVVTDGDPVAAAFLYLEDRIAEGVVPTAVSKRRRIETAASPTMEEIEATLCRKARSTAPAVVAEAVRAAVAMPFAEAMRVERRLFDEAVSSSRSKALRHLFFAERAAAKPTEAVAEANQRPVDRVGVIGAGTMGAGIALAFAGRGYPVFLCEADATALDRGMGRIRGILAHSVSRGTITEKEAAAKLSMIAGCTAMEALADANLVVEAAYEDMTVKKEIFSRLDRIAKPGAILATNTSYLDVDEIAAETSRPQDVAGLHFFSPAHVMRLVEIVRGARTAPDVIATILKIARALEKQPVVVGNCHGFVGNRMLMARNRELAPLIIEGASPATVDKAFRRFGWPMGPCEMQDLAGLDISWRNRKTKGMEDPLSDQLCELGRFGQKSGRGWYQYAERDRTPHEDPVLLEIAERLALKQDIRRRNISEEEIIDRTHRPMVQEGRQILTEGIATRSSDIDVIWTHGYGFPKDLGGPMFWSG